MALSLFTNVFSNTKAMPDVDREALCAIFDAANGRNWPKYRGWCTDADIREWHGVRVNAEGRVVELHLLEDESGKKPEANMLFLRRSINLLHKHEVMRSPPDTTIPKAMKTFRRPNPFDLV